MVLLRSPAIYSEELIPPGWESIYGLLKRFTNTGSGIDLRSIITKKQFDFLSESEQSQGDVIANEEIANESS